MNSMNKKARQLADCLQQIADEEMNLQECISRFPQIAEELMIASRLKNGFINDPALLKDNTRKRLIKTHVMTNLIDREKYVTNTAEMRYIQYKLIRRFAMSWIIILTTLISLVSGGGIVYASENALPGDGLYPLKTWVEDMRLAVASDEIDAGLYLQFSEKRFEEIFALIDSGEFEKIEETLGAYEKQNKLMEQSISKVQAQDAEKAIQLRKDLEIKLQEQARRIENYLDDKDKSETPLQESVREMLQTNKQLRERITEVDGDQVIEESVVQEQQLQGGENANINGESENPGKSSASIHGKINGELNTFEFDLSEQGKNGVYAVISGSRFDCTMESGQAICSADGAPNKGVLELFDQETNQFLYSFTYEYNFSFDHSWQGEKEDTGNDEAPGSEAGGSRGTGGNSNNK